VLIAGALMLVGAAFAWFRGPKGDEVIAEDLLDIDLADEPDAVLAGAPTM
jgi:hypothetical protein